VVGSVRRLGGFSGCESLVRPDGPLRDVPRLAVPALQGLQADKARGSPFHVVRYQDEGVVGPVFEFAGFAKARQAEPIGVARPPLGIRRAS
jgi:hypothetical protein